MTQKIDFHQQTHFDTQTLAEQIEHISFKIFDLLHFFYIL